MIFTLVGAKGKQDGGVPAHAPASARLSQSLQPEGEGGWVRWRRTAPRLDRDGLGSETLKVLTHSKLPVLVYR